ncbi:MAG TPA: shikimate dehydrogenase [Acidimicrobiales bacterium]|jgi:shikimate dehydrogenase
MRPVTASTRVAGLIGHPVEHSLSPVIHNAAYEALDLDWVYVALPVAPGAASQVVRSAGIMGIVGLSVTMPHKAPAARAVDRLTPIAERLGVVNTVTVTDDGLEGDSTDGPGFIASIRAEGIEPAGMAVAVIGTGGAARAVIDAMATAGASTIAMIGRTADNADRDDIVGADLIVNATPVGMEGGPDPHGLAVDPPLLSANQVVVDLVYRPAITPTLAAARDTGCTVVGGLGMLVHQAALQIERWSGKSPPLAAMADAAATALAGGTRRTR